MAVVTNPAANFEVLAPSTEALDRGEKFSNYQNWYPTLTDQVLVAQDRPQVEHYQRQADGSWSYRRHHGLDAAAASDRVKAAHFCYDERTCNHDLDDLATTARPAAPALPALLRRADLPQSL